MKRPFVKASIGAAAFCALLLVPVQGCTNLDEVPSSAITPNTFFKNEAEVVAALAGVYAQLRNTTGEGDYYGISEVSTDEMVVPTRGQDWYDNGTWLELHRQTWSPTSGATLSYFNNAWNTAFAGVARANVLLDALTRVHGLADSAGIKAETRTLRAFYYYLLMDLFGGVPIVTETEIKPRPRSTRAELFQFIESELLAARADLPRTRSTANNGRVTKGAADAILASMYLNAGVFTRDTAGAGATQIKATAYNSCAGVSVAGGLGACQAAVNRADSIISQTAVYQLADTFAKNFRADNGSVSENIFVVKFIAADGLGFNNVMRGLHYYQFTPGPWNGFAALAQTYNAFDPLDQRRKIFLVGPQVNVETGAVVCERPGCATKPQLVFTTTIANVTAATEGEGARIYKWPADPKHVGPNNGNDYAWFRLGEIMLIKAEAELEGGTGAPSPLTLLQQVRARAVPQPDTLSVVNRDVILRERLFELTGEAKRRQDLIRHGQYTQAWQFKLAGAQHLVLLPIPHTQIDANPMLTQNPGYP